MYCIYDEQLEKFKSDYSGHVGVYNTKEDAYSSLKEFLLPVLEEDENTDSVEAVRNMTPEEFYNEWCDFFGFTVKLIEEKDI